MSECLVGHRWSSSHSRPQKRLRLKEVKKVLAPDLENSLLSVLQELMMTMRLGAKLLSASESRTFPQSKIPPCQRAVSLGDPLSYQKFINDVWKTKMKDLSFILPGTCHGR